MLSYNVKNALLTTRLCQYLEPLELDMLILHNKVVNFKPGQTIVRQGRKSKGMYIIIEGKASVTAKILGEGVTNLATLERGNFIGEVNLIDKGPSTATVIALTEVKCLFMSAGYFDMLALFFTEIRFKIIRAIAKEVCYRIQDEYYKIIDYIKNSDMTTMFLFGRVIQSTTKPGPISFEESGIDITLLKHTEPLTIFTPDEFNRLIKQSVLIKTSKNCTLVHQEEGAICAYLVLQGAVQTSIAEENKNAKLSVFGPLSFFGTLTCVDGMFPALCNYITCESALLLKFTEANLMHIQKHHIHLWYKIFELIVYSIVGLERAADKLDVRLNSERYNR